MKKISYLLLFGICTLLSCRDDRRGIEMTYFTDFFINAGQNPFETLYFEPDLTSQADFFLGTDKESIKDIHLTFGQLRNQEGIDYDFIEEISISVNSVTYEVGFRNDIRNNEDAILDIVPNATNVKDFLVQDEFKLIVRIRFRYSPVFTIEENRLELRFEAFK